MSLPRAQQPADLHRRLAEAQATIAALLGGQIDAVVDSGSRTPVLLALAQKSLRESEERYRGIVETTNEAIWTMDNESRITFVNRRFAEMLGYSVTEILGESYVQLVAEENRARAAMRVERTRQGYMEEYEIDLVRKDGSRLWVLLKGSPIRDADGNYTGTLIVMTDRTRKREIEEALRQSEEKNRQILFDSERLYRSTFDAAPVGIVHVGLDGQWLRVNQRLCDLLGYRCEELLSRPVQQLVHAEKAGSELAAALEEMVSGRLDRYVGEETRYLRADGSTLLARVNASIHRDAEGQPRHFILVIEDIGERRTLERQAHEREERFTQLANNISEIFFIVDAQFRETLYINPAYEKVWGRSVQSIHDRPSSFIEAVHPDDRPAMIENVSRIQRGERPPPIEFRVVHLDGAIRWVTAHATPIRNAKGEVYRIGGIATDITERRNAMLALEESVTRFRKLTEASFDAIDISQDSVILEVNRGFLEIFGYDREEDVVGRHESEFVAEESRAEVARQTSRPPEGSYEFVGMRKDGKRIFLEATAKEYTFNGRPARIAALRDVTERRALEDRFRQAQKMDAVGRLAGGVAHDFNNLLMIITGYTDLVLQGLMTGDSRRDDLEQIRKAADAAASLTRQLLAFSRQQVIEPAMIAVEDVVAAASKMLERLIGEDIELVTRLNAIPATVFIDPGQLEQVVMNLVVNARDAMPTGGVLTIETSIVELSAREARLRGVLPARYARLAVSDIGVGIDAVTRDRIFEPFFTTKEQGKGTGLGLATVYGIVEQGGGFLLVDSRLGEGATFAVYLPLHEDTIAPPPQGFAVRSAPQGNETILLVEDSDGVRDIAWRVLTELGYQVLSAPNANAALEISRGFEGPIHLLLTDVVMPGISGRILAEKIQLERPEARLLFMSGYTDDAVLRHGVLRAETQYLQKPFSPHALGIRVREVLDVPQPVTT